MLLEMFPSVERAGFGDPDGGCLPELGSSEIWRLAKENSDVVRNFWGVLQWNWCD